MTRTKIELPGHFNFTCNIPVRITDINYGGHVGNDTVLSIIHEARMQFLQTYGYTEMKFAGVGMIMADAAIEFKNELFYGDVVETSVAVGEISKVSFTLYYQLEKEANNQKIKVAVARTGMVCYDYTKKKIISVPEEARVKLGKSINNK